MTLTPPDAAIVAGDPALPGLAHLLDAERLAERLAGLLPGCGGLQLRPSYLRYKPGTSCLAGFEAETAQGRLDLAAKAYKPQRYGIERARRVPPGLRSPLGPVALPLDELAVMVRLVPYDRALRALPKLVDAHARRALLDKLVPDLAGCDWRRLRHKPGRRHIGLLLEQGSRGLTPRAIVKLYAPDDFVQARQGARFAAATGGPLLLGGSSRHAILASAWQPGHSLAEVHASEPLAGAGFAAAGRALAAIHALEPRALPVRTLDAEAQAVMAAALALAQLAPELAPRVTGLAVRVAGLVLASSERLVPLHGDFSADQVVVQPAGVRLIDWDKAGIGPRALDLGSFIARLEADAGAAGAAAPEATIAAFVEGYAASAGERPRSLALWTAAALLRLVGEPFRQRRADWPEQVRALLGRVERYLEPARGAAGRARARSA